MDVAQSWGKFRGLWSTPARKALLGVIGVTGFLVVVSLIFMDWDYAQAPATDRLEHLKLYVSLFKAIIIGLGVALAGVLIPAILAESSEAFARLKESRDFYSKAKTGIDYLPLRLSALPLKEASALIQEVHYFKHQAQLYGELKLHLLARYPAGSPLLDPDEWDEWMYNTLFGLRGVLEKNAQTWDKTSPQKRLALLLKVKPSVNEVLEEERLEQKNKR